MSKVAIYPGTFDPITFGHADLVKRAQRLFDRILIAVSQHSEKQPLFSLEERVSFIQKVFEKEKNVEVIGFNGLLYEFAKEQHADVILRGLRVVSDFDYEFQMASMNRQLAPEIETVFLSPADQYTYISSSLVREIILRKGDVSKFVPKEIEEAINMRKKSI